MRVFRVMFKGEPIFIRREEGELMCGFYVNEYVVAANEQEAQAKARNLVKARLDSDRGIRTTADTLTSLRIDLVEGASWLKMLRKEGLSLFPADAASK